MSFQNHLDLSLFIAIKAPFYHRIRSVKKLSDHEIETNQLVWKKKYLSWTFFVGWKIPQHHPFRKLAWETSFFKKMDGINKEFSFKKPFKKPRQYIQNFKLSSCPTWSECRLFTNCLISFAHLSVGLDGLSFRQVFGKLLTLHKWIALLFWARQNMSFLLVDNIEYLNYKYLLGRKFLNPVTL